MSGAVRHQVSVPHLCLPHRANRILLAAALDPRQDDAAAPYRPIRLASLRSLAGINQVATPAIAHSKDRPLEQTPRGRDAPLETRVSSVSRRCGAVG